MVVVAIPRAGAQTLRVGDPAPKLDVKSFVKGEPVAAFDFDDFTKAVETQERAVRLAKGTELEKDKDLTDRLEQYKKAAKQ